MIMHVGGFVLFVSDSSILLVLFCSYMYLTEVPKLSCSNVDTYEYEYLYFNKLHQSQKIKHEQNIKLLRNFIASIEKNKQNLINTLRM